LLFALGALLYLLSTGLHYAAIASMEQREAEGRAAEARALARESQLQALKFQLNPHFLFNSLHSIAALATLDGPRAREMCIRLADFLRSSLALGEIENAFDPESLAAPRDGIGLAHVRRRLAMRYGDDAFFSARADGAVYRVSLRLPCE
jgi:LytS/YehU family sensor histidine kinase